MADTAGVFSLIFKGNTSDAESAIGRLSGRFKDLEGAAKSVSGSVTGPLSNIKSAVAGIGAALSAFTIASGFKEFIADLAGLDDMAERVGGTVETLSSLKQVAKETGFDFSQLDGGLQKLARSMSTALQNPASQSARAFREIGVSALDTNGKLKETDKLFIELASTLGEYEDGAGKVALVQALLGKSGADLIPFMKDMNEYAELSIKVTSEQAAQAETLEKTWSKLKLAFSSGSKALYLEAMPAVTGFSRALLDLVIETKKSDNALRDVSEKSTFAKFIDATAIGVARVIDVFMGLWGVLKTVGQAIGAFVATGVASFSNFADGFKAAISFDFEGVKRAINSQRTQLGTIGQAFREDFAKNIFPEKLFSDSVKTAIDKARADVSTRTAQDSKKPSLFGPGGKDDTKVVELKDIELLKSAIKGVEDELKTAQVVTEQWLKSFDARKATIEFEQAIGSIDSMTALMRKFDAESESALAKQIQAERNFLSVTKEIELAQRALVQVEASAASVSDPKQRVAYDKERLGIQTILKDLIEKQSQAVIKLTDAERAALDTEIARERSLEKIRVLVTRAVNDEQQRLSNVLEDEQTRFSLEEKRIALMGEERISSQVTLAQDQIKIEYARQRRDLQQEINKLIREGSDPAKLAELQTRLGGIAEIEKARLDNAGKLIVSEENQRIAINDKVETLKTADGWGRRFFGSLFEGGKAFRESLKGIGQDLKHLVIDQLYQATLRPWIINLVANLTGGSAQGLAQAAGIAPQGGGILGALFGGGGSGGGLGGIGDLLFGGSGGGLLGAVGSGFNSLFGINLSAGFSGLFGGASQLISGTLGGMSQLGLGFGEALSGAISSLGGFGAALGSAIPVIGGIIAVASAIGLFDDTTGLRFNSGDRNRDGTRSGADALRSSALGDWFAEGDFKQELLDPLAKRINQLDDAIIKNLLKPDLIAQVKAKVEGLVDPGWLDFENEGEFKAAFEKGGLQFLKSRFSTIFDFVGAGLGRFIDDFSGTSDELLQLVGNLASIDLKSFSDEVLSFVTSFKGAASDLPAYVQVVGQFASALKSAGASGSFGRFAGADAGFLSSFGTAIQSVFTRTVDIVREQSDKASLTLVENWRNANEVVTLLADNFDGALASSQKLAAASQERLQVELQLVSSIFSALKSASAESQSLQERLTVSSIGGDKAALTEFYNQRSVAALGQLASANDPAVIDSLRKQLNSYLEASFNLLDDGQKQEKLQEYLDKIADVEQRAVDRLNETLDEVNGQGDVNDTSSVAAAMRNAIEIGAAAIEAAAATLSASAEQVAQANAVPRQINVNITEISRNIGYDTFVSEGQ